MSVLHIKYIVKDNSFLYFFLANTRCWSVGQRHSVGGTALRKKKYESIQNKNLFGPSST